MLDAAVTGNTLQTKKDSLLIFVGRDKQFIFTRLKIMKVFTSKNCKRCHFYHGEYNIVCSIHPYGPNNNHCSEFQIKTDSQNRLLQLWNIRAKLVNRETSVVLITGSIIILGAVQLISHQLSMHLVNIGEVQVHQLHKSE